MKTIIGLDEKYDRNNEKRRIDRRNEDGLTKREQEKVNTLNKVRELVRKGLRKKYMEEFTERDIYFFLGTTKRYHHQARNPFIIIGVFYPPKLPPNEQMSLF